MALGRSSPPKSIRCSRTVCSPPWAGRSISRTLGRRADFRVFGEATACADGTAVVLAPRSRPLFFERAATVSPRRRGAVPIVIVRVCRPACAWLATGGRSLGRRRSLPPRYSGPHSGPRRSRCPSNSPPSPNGPSWLPACWQPGRAGLPPPTGSLLPGTPSQNVRARRLNRLRMQPRLRR